MPCKGNSGALFSWFPVPSSEGTGLPKFGMLASACQGTDEAMSRRLRILKEFEGTGIFGTPATVGNPTAADFFGAG
jgi:hypothetical protein